MRNTKFRIRACLFFVIYLFGAFLPSVKCYAESTEEYEAAISIREGITVSSRFLELFKDNKNEDTVKLIPGGEVFGIKIDEPYLTVSETSEGSAFMRGDRIIKAGGKDASSPDVIGEVLKSSSGKPIKFEIIRSGERTSLTVTPKCENGEYKLGITLRGMAAGIGTVTFIDPKTMSFGGLGHGVYSPDGHSICEIEEAHASGVLLGSVKRGEAGKPGELSGVLTDKDYGNIYINNECGVFGELTNYDISGREAIEIGKRDFVKCGEAEIISTLKSGTTMRYKIEITDIERNEKGSKCFKIKACDPALLAISGGIVRGMSGSPIIQDGKLVGAVTHVMVANPTEGYGIFIENMLNAAQSEVIPKAA